MNNTITNRLTAIYENDHEGEYCACEVWTAFNSGYVTILAQLMPEYAWLTDRPHSYSMTLNRPLDIKDFGIACDECAARVLFPNYDDSSDYYADYRGIETAHDSDSFALAYEFVPYEED